MTPVIQPAENQQTRGLLPVINNPGIKIRQFNVQNMICCNQTHVKI